MNLYIFILEKEDYLDALLEAMIEAEIEGISIIDATGARKVLAEDIPIFAGIIQAMQGDRGRHKIILGISENESIEELKEILSDLAPDLLDSGLRIFSFRAEQGI